MFIVCSTGRKTDQQIPQPARKKMVTTSSFGQSGYAEEVKNLTEPCFSLPKHRYLIIYINHKWAKMKQKRNKTRVRGQLKLEKLYHEAEIFFTKTQENKRDYRKINRRTVKRTVTTDDKYKGE